MLNILQANIMNKINNKKYKKLDKKFLDDALNDINCRNICCYEKYRLND
jgi:hypothetical protein